jgi:hypothetical protein
MSQWQEQNRMASEFAGFGALAEEILRGTQPRHVILPHRVRPCNAGYIVTDGSIQRIESLDFVEPVTLGMSSGHNHANFFVLRGLCATCIAHRR